MPELVQGGNESTSKKKKNKNLIYYIAGGGVLLVVIVVFFVKKSNSSATTSGTTTTVPASTDSLDPNTIATLQSLGLLNGSGSNTGTTGATGAQGPAGPAGPAGPSGSSGNGSGGGNAPVSLNVPNGYGGWMPVTFPGQSALNAFFSALGVSGGYYPNGLNYSTISGAVTSNGGTIVTPPTRQGKYSGSPQSSQS